MYRASLQRIDADDPRWGPPPARPPRAVVSAVARAGDGSAARSPLRRVGGLFGGRTPDARAGRRVDGTLIAYEWIVDGRAESHHPDDTLDVSGVYTLDDTAGLDAVRFEIHSVASPVSITVTRAFDLGSENPSDYDSVLEWLAPGNSAPEGVEVVREKWDGGVRWRLDVPVAPTREASHITVQAVWSGVGARDFGHHSAIWLFGVAGDPGGMSREQRIEARDARRAESGIKPATVGDGGPVRWIQDCDSSGAEARLDAVMASPAGRAFATVSARAGLSAAEVAVPQMSVWVCVDASNDTEVWRSDRNEILEYLNGESPKHRGFMRQVMAQAGASWWFQTLDRERQVWVSKDGNPPLSESLVVPSEPPSGWERYAQKHAGGLYTTTLVGDTSPMAAAVSYGVGDFRPGFGEPPYATWRMEIDAAARVLEIHGAHDWHRLCVEYPAPYDDSAGSPDFSGDPGRLTPDWSRVAADWDAAHLSFGGYLSAEQVRVESERGWTYHWAWDCECTLWLRWMFTGFERIEDQGFSEVMPSNSLGLRFAAVRETERGEAGTPLS